MKFSPELENRFSRLVSQYPWKRSALIPMLLYAQDEVGYINDEVVADIAHRLELSELDVRNVISYYSLLRTKPAGKYVVQVCTNISCLLLGADELFTPDGRFSLEEVECIGACSWAPAIQVNYDFHLDVTPEKMDKVLDQYATKAQA